MSSEQERIAHRDKVIKLKADIDQMALALREHEPGTAAWKAARQAMGAAQVELRRAYDAYCGGRWLEPKTAKELGKYEIE